MLYFPWAREVHDWISSGGSVVRFSFSSQVFNSSVPCSGVHSVGLIGRYSGTFRKLSRCVSAAQGPFPGELAGPLGSPLRVKNRL